MAWLIEAGDLGDLGRAVQNVDQLCVVAGFAKGEAVERWRLRDGVC